MTIRAEQLQKELRDFRNRAAAIESAVSEGESAIEPAIELLNDRNEAVRWSGIRILSEIGDRRAVTALIDMLERGRNVVDAANALRNITGQDLGEDVGAWRSWTAQDAGVADSSGFRRPSDDELLQVALRDLPVEVSGSGQQYSIDVSLPEGRTQRVWVDFGCTDPQGDAIVQLCTACGPVDDSKYEWALKLNMTIPYVASGSNLKIKLTQLLPHDTCCEQPPVSSAGRSRQCDPAGGSGLPAQPLHVLRDVSRCAVSTLACRRSSNACLARVTPLSDRATDLPGRRRCDAAAVR